MTAEFLVDALWAGPASSVEFTELSERDREVAAARILVALVDEDRQGLVRDLAVALQNYDANIEAATQLRHDSISVVLMIVSLPSGAQQLRLLQDVAQEKVGFGDLPPLGLVCLRSPGRPATDLLYRKNVPAWVQFLSARTHPLEDGERDDPVPVWLDWLSLLSEIAVETDVTVGADRNEMLLEGHVLLADPPTSALWSAEKSNRPGQSIHIGEERNPRAADVVMSVCTEFVLVVADSKEGFVHDVLKHLASAGIKPTSIRSSALEARTAVLVGLEAETDSGTLDGDELDQVFEGLRAGYHARYCRFSRTPRQRRARFNFEWEATIEVQAAERPGVVADVASVLVGFDGNIEWMDARVTSGPSGSALLCRTLLRVTRETTPEVGELVALQRSLEQISTVDVVSIYVTRESIPNPEALGGSRAALAEPNVEWDPASGLLSVSLSGVSTSGSAIVAACDEDSELVPLELHVWVGGNLLDEHYVLLPRHGATTETILVSPRAAEAEHIEIRLVSANRTIWSGLVPLT
jgi:glycine cleavage system regulatory protein